MEYGNFSKDRKEFVITKPDTPRPWFNYLFNKHYHALVSQTGGGFSYYKDPKCHRILRYDHIHTDRPGRYVYIRDEDKNELWSCNWQPLMKRLDDWKCVHGLGYTSISARKNGLKCDITYIVPGEAPLEIWEIKLANETGKTKKATVFPFVEFVSGNVEMETVYRNILCLYNEARYDRKTNTIISFKHQFVKNKKSGFSFFNLSVKPDGYEVNKEKFFGRYNDSGNPSGLISGKLRNGYARGEDTVGVFQKTLELKPNETKKMAVVLGYTEDKRKIAGLIKKYSSLKSFTEEYAKIRSKWDGIIEDTKVETPDKDFDTMVNIWGKYQLSAITCWRGTSQYHGGEGGLGYRDTAQDIEGLLSLDMALAREKLDKILFWQYKCGHAVSGFSDVEGSWDKTGGFMTGKSDVAVWLPFTVISYIKETGDISFLEKEYKFHDGNKASVYEHIIRAVRHIYNRRGRNGFPLIYKADWNDAYDHVGYQGRGESVWLAMALARACLQVKELGGFLGDKKIEREMSKKFCELKKVINGKGWDGKWYIAAINDDGYKIGSAKNTEGKVPLNSQTWAILSGVVEKHRIKSILDKIDGYLDTRYGPALFLPSYSHFNEGIGRVTAFAPGTKENAAVFSHACAFKIVADCEIGRGNKAFETYTKLCPMSKAKADHDKYKVEPYVWAEYVVGPGNKANFGEGSFTWNTGTAPWMHIAATEWILGARRDFKGLRIDPCIPSYWKKCGIRRPFRSAVYDIEILNPDGVEKGVREITVDGKSINGTLIYPHRDGKTHKVTVLMGGGK
ncbi:hypothetical protein M0R36_02130 [bacterium]|nr:hypothetical protein [bacterium]